MITRWASKLGALVLGAALLVAPGARADEPEDLNKEAPAAAAPAHEAKEADKAPAKNDGEKKDADKKDGEEATSTAAKAGPEGEGDLSPAEEKAGDTAAASHDPEKYAAFIRGILPKIKEKVLGKIEAKMEKAQEAKMERLSMVLGWVSMLGFVLLLMPIFLAKKYPGKLGVLFKTSAIAAFASVIVMNLFAAIVLLLKNVQGALAKFTNPQIKIVEAALDGIGDSADHLISFGPQLIQPTLDQLSSSEESVPVALLENVQKIAKDAQPFLAAAKWFKGMLWIFDYLPLVMTTMAIFLFLVGARPMLVELIKLPARAAAGENTEGVVKEAFRKVGRELLATLCLIVLLAVVTLLSGELLALAVRPAVENFLNTFFVDVIYVQTPGASSGLIFGSLAGTVVFLVLNVMVVLLSTGFFLGKAHKIFQQRFQEKVPLSAHKKFWGWGTLALLWAQVFPVAFVLGAEPLVEKLLEKGFGKEEPNWTLVLLGGSGVFVVGFLFCFWAFRGLKGLAFLKKYDLVAAKAASVPPPAMPLGEPTPA